MSYVPADQYVITREGILFEAGFAASFFGTTLEEELSIEAIYLTESHPGKFDSHETLAWLSSFIPLSADDRKIIKDHSRERSNQLIKDPVREAAWHSAYEAYELENNGDQ